MRTLAGRAFAAVLLLLLVALPVAAQAPSRTVILSTTTSTQDSGLLDVLLPLFERKSGFQQKAQVRRVVRIGRQTLR